ncbi:hypothetical protein LAT59_00200 [Candidatus Gracilibacteria bacterium]|nr:hypothetical protein [Candidatus Gracilibacteria bacterium]
MQHYNDTILYQVHQHIFVLIFKILSILLPYLVIVGIFGYIFSWSILFILILILVGGVSITAWYYFFWTKSYFCISNEKIIVKVRNGLFSKFHMSIHFRNIRDTAFSKNNIFHYLFNYGTFFARSSAGAVGDLEAQYIPNIEKVYKIINALHSMDESERKKIQCLEDVGSFHAKPHPNPLLKEREQATKISAASSSPGGEELGGGFAGEKTQGMATETLEEAIEKEKNILLSVQGLKEVVLLDGKDRRYIFEHEEERNHGVHECLRRQVLFAATHDSTFRDPDEAIVMQAGEKVVFPVVEFHEIKRKKVSSSSPGLTVHNYLVPKFQDFDSYDATLLIGFDI